MPILSDKKFKLDLRNNLTYDNLHKSECKILSNKVFNERSYNALNLNVQQGLKRTSSAF